MATFAECLYNANLCTTARQARFDLAYICCTPHHVVATDGHRIYRGCPTDYPWAELVKFYHLPSPPKPTEAYNPLVEQIRDCRPPETQVFLRPVGKPPKPKAASMCR